MKKLFKTLFFTGIFLSIPMVSFAKENTSAEVPVTMFRVDSVPPEASKPGACCKTDLLEKAINYNFCTNSLCEAMEQMEKSCKFYYAQNDIVLKNGSFDLHRLFCLKQLCDAKKIKITVTLAYENPTKNECEKGSKKKKKQKEEFTFGLYKDTDQCKLSKKFMSQEFKHKYLMHKYIIPLTAVETKPNAGIQKYTATVNLSDIKDKNTPLYAVITHMQKGFKFKDNKKQSNKSCQPYAYLIEVEKSN
ncbi:MAG: hypothetical protein PHX18_00900 [Candidatus Gastranaerophilales bacterium]|nr:hypothetical protein [Candidatus Gastranaerophilales bacterium]